MDIGSEHQMVVKNTYPTGAQEWFCPTCGRHFILQWPPNYKRIVLDEGDEQAIHSGGTNGLVMGSPEINPSEAKHNMEEMGGSSDLDDPYLSPWADWLGDQKL
jgi:hypothetical protein